MRKLAADQLERSYERAIAILQSRRRLRRPLGAPVPSNLPVAHMPNGMPNFKGTPQIVGMREWLQKLGHTDADIDGLNIIHVAGTKGKGSTCAFVESLLRAHGRRTGFPRRTGLYTSPHLLETNERLRIDFEPLPKPLFAKYLFDVYDRLGIDISVPGCESGGVPSPESTSAAIGPQPRYLQLLALLSFHVFLREGVDVAVYETHHGGEFDVTNVIRRPVVTAVTPIGIDHIRQLGPTVENIAWHKAGILKTGARAFSAMQTEEVAEVLRARGKEKGVEIEFVGVDLTLPDDGLWVDVQKGNCSLAKAVADAFLAERSPGQPSHLSAEDIAEGVRQFRWPGRFQTIRRGANIWFLDGAHNNLSIVEAVAWFKKASLGTESANRAHPRAIVFAQISYERDGEAVLRELARSLDVQVQNIIFTLYNEAKVSSLEEGQRVLDRFVQIWSELQPDIKAWTDQTVDEAISRAEALAGPQSHILVTGSLYLVAEAIHILESSNASGPS